MTACPLCRHHLYHESPPLLKLPPLKVYCDGCDGWLAWEPTNETRRADKKAPICPACKKPMVLKNLNAGGLRFGCETWKACGTGMRSESATVTIDVPVYRLVAREIVKATDAETHFGRLDRATQERKTAIEERQARYKTPWWKRGPGLGLDDVE